MDITQAQNLASGWLSQPSASNPLTALGGAGFLGGLGGLAGPAGMAVATLGASGMFSSAPDIDYAISGGPFTSGDFSVNKPGVATWLIIIGVILLLLFFFKGK